MINSSRESHCVQRVGWLRTGVLSANDGIASTARFMAGVAAANATNEAIVFAVVVGLQANDMSLAAGAYVSIGSQSDTD